MPSSRGSKIREKIKERRDSIPERLNTSSLQINIIHGILLITMVSAIILSVIVAFSSRFRAMTPADLVSVSLEGMGMLICLILITCCSLQNEHNVKSRIFIQFIAVVFFMLFLDYLVWFSDGIAEYSNFTMITSTITEILEDFELIVLWFYIKFEFSVDGKRYEKRTRVIQFFCYFDMVTLIVNQFAHFLFYVDANGVYTRTPWYVIGYLPMTISTIIFFIAILTSDFSKLEKGIILTYVTFPLIGALLEYREEDVALQYPFLVLSIILIYCLIHLRRAQKVVEQEAMIIKQSTALMISQIQPHFLYNTLNTISNLCTKDPEEAEETTVMFSQYLRMNLDSLRRLDPVPFSAELDHIEIYLELEKKRFGDKLNVEWDIKEKKFLVPALGLQPIVENSVKHGITKKEEGGTLKFSTYRADGGVMVVISDDGVGFDPDGPMPDDGRSHVGMTNVRDRLKQMVNADMTVESSVGHGCKTSIFFPDEKK